MAKKFLRVIMTLVGVMFFAGCVSTAQNNTASTQPGRQQVATRSQESARAPTQGEEGAPAQVVPVQAPHAETFERVLGQFPTSSTKPVGKPWREMHREGFTGGYDVACKLLSLSARECVSYITKHAEGSCTVMEAPTTGIVLDRLTFTKGGKHEVQQGVRVDLKNPPSRTVEVCDLGRGVIAMRWHGCNNHALVRGWTKPLFIEVRRSLAQAHAPKVCEPSMRVNVWGSPALEVPGVRETIEATRPVAGGFFEPNRVSRQFGAEFRKRNASGALPRSTTPTPVSVYQVKPDGREIILWQGMVTGTSSVSLPTDFVAGDVIKVLFAGHAGLASPLSGDLRAERREFTHCVTHLHAIEAPAR